MSFINPFASLAGQVERFKAAGSAIAGAVQNVASTFTLGAVKRKEFTSSVPIVARIAERPAETAAIAATLINPMGAIAAIQKVGGAVASKTKQVFTSLSPLTQVGVIAATPVVVSVLKESPKARESLSTLPSGLVNLGENIGEFVEEPTLEKAFDVFKENPIIAGAAAIATGGALGVAGAKAVSSIAQTRALKDVADSIREASTGKTASLATVPASSLPLVAETTESLPTQYETAPLSATSTATALSVPSDTARKARRKPRYTKDLNISERIRVYGWPKRC